MRLVGEAVEWVPTCPISEITSSSLLPRSFDAGFTTVRFSCTSNRLGGAPTNGIAAFSGQENSMTSPVLISLIALSTVCGFM